MKKCNFIFVVLLIAQVGLGETPAVKDANTTLPSNDGSFQFKKVRDIRTSDSVYAVEFFPDGKRFAWTGFTDFAVHICSIADGKELRSIGGIVSEMYKGDKITRFPGHQGTVDNVIFLENGRRLISASFSGPIILSDTASGTEIRRLTLSKEQREKRKQEKGSDNDAMACTRDGRLLIDASGDMIFFFTIQTGATQASMKSTIGEISALACAPDGRTMVYGGKAAKIAVADVQTHKELRQVPGPTSPSQLVFSPDGKLLATAGRLKTNGDFEVQLFDFASGRLLRQMQSHSRYGGWIAFSPGGHYLLVAGGDDEHRKEGQNRVQVYDFDSGKTVATVPGDGRWVATSRNGDTAVTTDDHQIHLWTVPQPMQAPPTPAGTSTVGPEQFRQLNAIRNDLDRVTMLANQKRVSEAEKLLTEAENHLQQVVADNGLAPDDRVVAPLYKTIEQKRELVEQKKKSGNRPGPVKGR